MARKIIAYVGKWELWYDPESPNIYDNYPSVRMYDTAKSREWYLRTPEGGYYRRLRPDCLHTSNHDDDRWLLTQEEFDLICEALKLFCPMPDGRAFNP